MKLFALVAAALLLATGAQAALMAAAPESQVIPNEYIVVLQKWIKPEDKLALMNHVGINTMGSVSEEWNINNGEFQAFYLRSENTNDLLALSELPQVQYIEPAQNMRIFGTTNEVAFDDKFVCTKSRSLSWGLSRTVHPGGLPSFPIENVEYQVDSAACGNGVDIYVMDTGIQTTHQDFAPNRATWGADFTGEGQNDRHGHGTHVASTAGGNQYGLARCAKLVAVKVCNGGGSCPSNAILSGVQFTADAARAGHRKIVGNMSLGGGFSQASNDAVNAAVNAGAVMAVAAGNSNAPSCRYSPASAELAFTVMAADNTDTRSSFSNYDACSQIFASGSNISAAWIGSDSATRAASGTSMASPHAAGVAAKLWSKYTGLTTRQVTEQMVARGTKNVIKNAGAGSPNVLLHFNCDS